MKKVNSVHHSLSRELQQHLITPAVPYSHIVGSTRTTRKISKYLLSKWRPLPRNEISCDFYSLPFFTFCRYLFPLEASSLPNGRTSVRRPGCCRSAAAYRVLQTRRPVLRSFILHDLGVEQLLPLADGLGFGPAAGPQVADPRARLGTERRNKQQ